jgi:hypothetical protein
VRHAERHDAVRSRITGIVREVAIATAALTALCTAFASTSSAQLPTPAPAPPSPYHAPAMILAQPSDGGALPADKPVAVFRFTTGEATDPVDALSFTVTVDGVDRTALFELTTSVINGVASGEAWGPIDDPSTSASGPHDVRARICSMRGACTTVHASVSVTTPEQSIGAAANAAGVVPAASKNAPAGSSASAKKRGKSVLAVLDKVLQAVHILSR